MNSDQIVVIGEIVAAITGAIVGVLATWAVVGINNRRGNRLLITRISATPQINVTNLVRERLAIQFDGIPIKNLVLNILQVENLGRDITKPLEFRIIGIPAKAETGNDQPDFISLLVRDPLNKLHYKVDRFDLVFFRDFWNSTRAYKEEKALIYIFSSIELEFSVKGGGKGWYTQFGQSNLRKKEGLIAAGCFGILAIATMAVAFVTIPILSDKLTVINKNFAIFLLVLSIIVPMLFLYIIVQRERII